jgi:hypothetical protein
MKQKSKSSSFAAVLLRQCTAVPLSSLSTGIQNMCQWRPLYTVATPGHPLYGYSIKNNNFDKANASQGSSAIGV